MVIHLTMLCGILEPRSNRKRVISMDDRFAKVTWLFFDIGSTLVDERLAYEHRFRDMAQAAGVSASYITRTALDFYRRNRKGDGETAGLLGITVPAWHSEDEILYSDAAVCLATLRENYHIGIIANQLPGTAERLKAFGIGQYVDVLTASAEAGVSKPDPRIFQIALQQAGCLPENAVMIGDRVDNDIVPAKALGMKTIWIRQGFGQYWQITDESEMPDVQVDSLSDLMRMFGR